MQFIENKGITKSADMSSSSNEECAKRDLTACLLNCNVIEIYKKA